MSEEYLRDDRCKGQNMAYKWKIFMVITEHFMQISIFTDAHVCIISKVIGIKTEQRNMPVK